MHGFLPINDPIQSLKYYPLCILDEIGRDLPSMVEDKHFRLYAENLQLPVLPVDSREADAQLYYVRVGFLASAYINHVGSPPINVLPANIAVPLCNVCKRLRRPPILSYDGYALYNWKRFRSAGPIALGNIDTIQNFVHHYDEHWFILVHVEIEHLAAKVVDAIVSVKKNFNDDNVLNQALIDIATSVSQQTEVLRRIPEKMDPALYFHAFRPYIRFFENVTYEGVDDKPMNYRGETGAQSSIMPALVAFMKIKHTQSLLTDHLSDMKNFMPLSHRLILKDIESINDIRSRADKAAFNDVLEAMAIFREVHYSWAQEYINKRVADPRGTGGTPYAIWLKQLIDETRDHKIK